MEEIFEQKKICKYIPTTSTENIDNFEEICMMYYNIVMQKFIEYIHFNNTLDALEEGNLVNDIYILNNVHVSMHVNKIKEKHLTFNSYTPNENNIGNVSILNHVTPDENTTTHKFLNINVIKFNKSFYDFYITQSNNLHPTFNTIKEFLVNYYHDCKYADIDDIENNCAVSPVPQSQNDSDRCVHHPSRVDLNTTPMFLDISFKQLCNYKNIIFVTFTYYYMKEYGANIDVYNALEYSIKNIHIENNYPNGGYEDILHVT